MLFLGIAATTAEMRSVAIVRDSRWPPSVAPQRPCARGTRTGLASIRRQQRVLRRNGARLAGTAVAEQRQSGKLPTRSTRGVAARPAERALHFYSVPSEFWRTDVPNNRNKSIT